MKMLLTQSEFAKYLGVAFVTINRWENGEHEPTMKYKRKLIPLFNKIELFIKFSGIIDLNISIKPPSVTPTAPGEGIPDTVANKSDCTVIILKIPHSFNPNALYPQYDTL